MNSRQPTNTIRVTFEDGSIVTMGLREGFRFMSSLAREGWEIEEDRLKSEQDPKERRPR